MAGIEKYLADGEEVIFESRFGVARFIVDLGFFVAASFVGAAFGPAIVLAWIGFFVWVFSNRSSSKVYVTNRRLIRKKGAGSTNFEELRLDKVESVKNGLLGLRVVGAGATVIKLPGLISNISDLRKALAGTN